MRRPLVVLAAVLAFGVILLYQKEARRSLEGIPEPLSDVFIRAEASQEAILEGTAEKIERTYDGWVIILRIRRGLKVRLKIEGEARPGYGQLIRVTGYLYTFQQATNPGQFDLEAYYRHLGIYAGMKVSTFEMLSGSGDVIGEAVFSIRCRLIEAVEETADDEDKGIFEVLTCGYKAHLNEDIREEYTDFGLMFLVSFSGIHISMITEALYRLLRKSLGKNAAFLFSSSAVLFLFLLSGHSSSVFRAGLVCLFRFLAPLFKRKFDYLCAVSFSVILLIIDSPGIVFLSTFHYILGILLASGILYPLIISYLKTPVKSFAGSMIFLLSLQVSFLPIRLYWSFKISLFSFFSGLFSAVLLPVLLSSAYLGAVSAVFYGKTAVFFFGPGHVLLRLLGQFMDLLEMIPFMTVLTGRPSLNHMICYYLIIGTFLLFMRCQVVRRKSREESEEKKERLASPGCVIGALALIFLSGLFILRPERIPDQALRITALDVGQGDCTVVEYGRHVFVIDCGSTYSSDDPGETVLVPYLEYRGIGTIDGLFLTHGDLDHVSGTEAVLKETDVRKLYLSGHTERYNEYADILELCDIYDAEAEFLSSGDELISGGLSVQVLWPEKEDSVSGNDGSLVLYVTSEYASGLFTGDISTEAEERIRWPESVDYLKVAHHGSRYSTGQVFLDSVSIRASSVSAGRRNPYGHPSEDTVERLRKAGIPLFSTASCGAVSFLFDKGNLYIEPFLSGDQEFLKTVN